MHKLLAYKPSTTIKKDLKIVFVGDARTGKTYAEMCLAEKQLPTEYVPTVFDGHKTVFNYEGTVIDVALHDTAVRL